MKRETAHAFLAALAAAVIVAEAGAAGAAACANGVYRAGCVGPNGAVGVNKSTGSVHGGTAAPYASGTKCANGVYRAGCVGPNGAVGVNKATGAVGAAGAPGVQCRYVNGQRVCR
jgi:hypothetical protein